MQATGQGPARPPHGVRSGPPLEAALVAKKKSAHRSEYLRVRVTKKQMRALRAIAEDHEKSVSEYVRDLLGREIRKEQRRG